jgi:spore coat protein U-like protein
MNHKIIQLLATVAMLCSSYWVQAALTCSGPASTGFLTAYAPAGVVPNVNQGIVSFNCTRTIATDATSVLLNANNGANATGVQNSVRLKGANRISYEAYKDSACGALWTSAVLADYMSVPLLNVLGTQSISASFWGCITIANQLVAAGYYTDTVTMRIRNITNTAWLSSNGTFTVGVTNPATFSISTPPGNIVFTYTAFGSAVNASTTFKTTGTLNLPYTMSLDAYSGVANGLNYTLGIDSQAPPVSSRGSGAAQTHTINGNMSAGQAGACSTGSCTSSQVHTLFISY